MLSILVNILLFILVIGVLTFIHELGHFLSAKLIKATVLEFSLGFGPKLLSKKFKGTEYNIRLLPLGGFVKILGDGDPEKKEVKEKAKNDDGNLHNKPRLAQIFVMLAGVTMNILFAITMYFIVISNSVVGNSGWSTVLDWSYQDFKPIGASITKEVIGDVKYVELEADGSAVKANLPPSGTIKTIDGKEIEYAYEVRESLKVDASGQTTMEICNDDSCKLYTVNVSDAGTIGIMLPTNYYVVASNDGNAFKTQVPFSGEIKAIDGEEVKYASDILNLLEKDKNGKATLDICTETNTCGTYTVDVKSDGTIGVILSTNYYVELSYENNKVFAGFSHLINTVRLIGIKFGSMFGEAKTTGDYSEISNSVSGPVGIYFLIDYFKNLGFVTFLSVMGDLSLSLAIMNLLPIPALDGGRVGILLIESILRKELNEKVKTLIINGSFILLMILVIFIMVKDVLNIQNIKDMFR